MRAMTPAFASPEQVEGLPITTATDVYQLGMLLYLLLTGGWPYPRGSGSDAAMLLAICGEPPYRPSSVVAGKAGGEAAPGSSETTVKGVAEARRSQPSRLRKELAGDLDTIILTALRKEPERRYPSVAQMVPTPSAFSTGAPSRHARTP